MAYTKLGPQQKGENNATEFAFYGFPGGLNVKAAPQLVGDEDLTIALDGYLRPDGAFQMRNGMLKYGGAIGGTPNVGWILARFYQDVRSGVVVTPELTQVVAQGFQGNLYNVPSTGTPTLIGNIGGRFANPMIWARIQNPNDPHYTGGLTDCLVMCTGSGGPYVYDGTNLYTPAGWAAAASASYCAVVNGILWFGGIPAYPNQVFGTGDGVLQSMETLPAIRNFVLSSPVQGLIAQGSGATASLVIGRTQGLSVLYGTGPSTFFLQDVPFADGITSGRAMCSSNGVIYFLGHAGYYRFDGQTPPEQISQKVEPWILNDPLVSGYPMTQAWPLSWATVYNNRIHLGYCSNASTPNVILCYDLNLGGWTLLRPAGGIASMILLDAPSDPNPYEALVGSSTIPQTYQWDYLNSTSPLVYDDTTPVLAQAQSKFFKLGVPGTNKALQRYYPEFQNAGPFNAIVTVATDYGASTSNTTTNNPATAAGGGMWDSMLWDVGVWGGTIPLVPYGSPKTRLDYPGLLGESFAFGVNTTQANAPWIWSGASGVFSQRGRT